MKSVYYVPTVISGRRLSNVNDLATSSIASTIGAGIVGGISSGVATVVSAVVDNPGKIVAAIGVSAIPGPAAPG